MATSQKMAHPRGLYTLFFTEMWERFSYYGMRALLVLYLTTEYARGGFGMDRASALEIYGIFTGLVYLTPIIGGALADRILGQRRAIYIGGFLMAFGQFALAGSHAFAADEATRQWLFHLGLGLLIAGNGFFKPNISTIVGALYTDNDPRKDSAFTIFYMGINLGAFLSPIICGTLGEQVGWMYGFGSAGVGMLLATVWLYIEEPKLDGRGMPPGREGLRLKPSDFGTIAAYVAGSVATVLGFLALQEAIPEETMSVALKAVAVLAIAGVAYIIYSGTKGSEQWSRVGAILIFMVANIFFWSGFEQAGGTFNLFAAEEIDRNIFGYEIAASLFQSVNALAIFIFAPLFGSLWVTLAMRNMNPSTPVKFGLGLVLLSVGFVVMSFASFAASGEELISPMWLVGGLCAPHLWRALHLPHRTFNDYQTGSAQNCEHCHGPLVCLYGLGQLPLWNYGEPATLHRSRHEFVCVPYHYLGGWRGPFVCPHAPASQVDARNSLSFGSRLI